jgi:carboxyl-terminal processing protease
MTASAMIRRVLGWTAIALFLLAVAPLRADDTAPFPTAPKPTAAQLRSAAEAAEKAGNWEAAFTAYCHLFVADRGAPGIREKLNVALRRTQQLRRHRDPQFAQYATTVSVSDALNLFAEVFTKVPVLYVDRDRATPQILWENGINELNRALGNPVFRQAFLTHPQAEKIDAFRAGLRFWAKQPITDAKTARVSLRKLMTSAQDSFGIRLPSALVLEVVCGSCSGLDEYTIFLNPTQFNPDSPSAVPDLTAQGVYLTITAGKLFVAGVANGSWASYHAQPLRKGDQIITMNGRSMTAVTLADVADALRHPVDGFHLLEIAPSDPESMALLVQLPVVVPTVYAEGMTPQSRYVGYARIGSFTTATPRELDDAINRLKGSGARALVLDLRGNMGGSFLAGVETAKRFLPSGLIVTTQGQAAEVDNVPFSSDSGMTAHDIPIVILVDAETASAAEVFAAALKDNNRAPLVGMPTFGKGAIQYPLRLSVLDELDDAGKPKTNKSGGVRLTIAKLIAPRGGAINGIGIAPHILEADPTRQLELAVIRASELVPTSSSRPMMMQMMPPMMPPLSIGP